MEKTFIVIAEYGIHARPATRLVNETLGFDCDIFMESSGKKINLKSIMGVMSLGIYKGEEIKIITSGNGSEAALDKITNFILTEKLGRLK